MREYNHNFEQSKEITAIQKKGQTLWRSKTKHDHDQGTKKEEFTKQKLQTIPSRKICIRAPGAILFTGR